MDMKRHLKHLNPEEDSETKPHRPPSFNLMTVMLTGMAVWLAMTAFFSFFVEAGLNLRERLQTTTAVVSSPSPLPADAAGKGPRDGREPEGPGPFMDPLALFKDHRFESGMLMELVGIIIATSGILIWSWPVRRWFHRLRYRHSVDPDAREMVRRRVKRSAVAVGIGLPVALMAYQLVWIGLEFFLFPQLGNAQRDLHMLPDQFLIAGLSGLFMFLWQRHRTQHFYLEWLYDRDELNSRLPDGTRISIRANLLLMILMTTVLPLGIIVRFLTSGLSVVNDNFSQMSSEQIALLFGSRPGKGMPDPIMLLGHLKDSFLGQIPPVYIDVINTTRILTGLVIGFIVLMPYIVAIIRWTAVDMADQVYDLRRAMRRVSGGDLDALIPVHSNNELGELTLGFNSMLRGLEERNRIKGLFGQYLTSEVSEAILDGRVNLNGDHYEATIMFTDIRSFTAMSETMQPGEVFEFLNEYLDHMIEVILAKGGFIDKFIGDGILCVFGLPVRSDNHALLAMETARAMGMRLAELNAGRTAAGKAAIIIGSGIHTGPVIAGNVGNARRAQFTVIGDTVNLASRLEGLNKDYGSTILLSQTTWDALPPEVRDGIKATRMPAVEIRGKREPITVWRVD
jgi:class 3 adenylate cyclase